MQPGAPTAPRTSTKPLSWAEVARVSAAASGDGEAPAPPSLAPGDTVQHPRFGACTVHSVNEDIVQIAKESGRPIRLSKKIVEFTFVGVEGERRVFTTSTQ